MEEDINAGISKKVTLVIIIITMFVASVMMSSVHIALPTIGAAFNMEAVLLGWVITAMTLPQTAILLAAGRLADIYGRKKIFLYGMVLFTIASFLCAIANSGIALISYRVLQGISGGMVFGTQMAIISSVFPGEERGRALGISVSAAFVGLSVGPFLGGVMTQQLGWRSIFYLAAFLSLAAVFLTLWKLKGEWAEARGERFDLGGSIVFGISIVVVMYGFTVLLTPTGMVLVVLGILGIIAFVRWEARTDSPILNLGLFRRNNAFVFSNLANLIHSCSAFAATVLMSLYLQYSQGFSPQTAGIIMLAQPVVMAIFSPISGRLSDRVEPRIVASVGVVFTCLALVLFIFLTEATALGYVIASLAILGFGAGLFSSPNSNAIMGSVASKSLGVASGTQGTMRSCGQMLGMGVVMIVFSVYIGGAAITPEYYPAFLTSAKIGFTIFAALCFGAIFTQLAGRRTRQE